MTTVAVQLVTTGWCPIDGDVELDSDGKCVKCKHGAVRAMTSDGIDGQRYRPDPRDSVPVVEEQPVVESKPPTPGVIVLPNIRTAKEWLRQGRALRKDLQTQRRDCEAAVKGERKKIQMIDRAIVALDATLATFAPTESRWALNYDRCVVCNTTDAPYKALGRCVTCESQHRRDKKKGTTA